MTNLGACSTLRAGPERSVWYRAVRPVHWTTALDTTYSQRVPSRFNPATAAAPTFPILYLAENHLVALYEVEALIGSPWPGGVVLPNSVTTWVILNVQVTLQRVADLTDPDEQAKLGTTAQELTGDWRGYLNRSPHTPVMRPVGAAPTQNLGQALYKVRRRLEGFRTISARWPTHRNLAIFPDRLLPGSSVVYTHPITGETLTLP